MRASSAAANRIELESQILSAALRQSWELSDLQGMNVASEELVQIFPDLLPVLKHEPSQQLLDYYQCLQLCYSDSPTLVQAQYLKMARNFLKQFGSNIAKDDYFKILNAGFVLRKPRLRLSHDLVGVRGALLNKSYGGDQYVPLSEEKVDLVVQAPTDTVASVDVVGGADVAAGIDVADVSAPAMDLEVEKSESKSLQPISDTPAAIDLDKVMTSVSKQDFTTQPVSDQSQDKPIRATKPKPAPVPQTIPMLVELLQYAQIIGPMEVQALKNQMAFAPEIPVKDLILGAGYVNEKEMKSLQLAEYLVTQGTITLAQFAVAMYDERTQGTRMAESLQNRGWLETSVNRYPGSQK